MIGGNFALEEAGFRLDGGGDVGLQAELALARLTERVHRAVNGDGPPEFQRWAKGQVEVHESRYATDRELAEALLAAEILYKPLIEGLERSGKGSYDRNKIAEKVLFGQATVEKYNSLAGASRGSNARGYLLHLVREQAGF